MLTRMLKWGSIVGVLLAAMSWHGPDVYALLLDLAVCVGVIVVTKQAVRAHEYLWASAFVGMALLLNPIVPVLTPAGNLMLLLFAVCLSAIDTRLWRTDGSNDHSLSESDYKYAPAR